MVKNKKRKSADPSQNQKGVFVSALIGGGIGFALIMLLALVSPFVLLGFSNPNATVLPITAACVFLGGLSGATVSARGCKASPFAAGMLSAGVIAVPMVLISLFVGGSLWLAALGAVLASLALSSFAGAYLTSRAGKSKKRNMKKALRRR